VPFPMGWLIGKGTVRCAWKERNLDVPSARLLEALEAEASCSAAFGTAVPHVGRGPAAVPGQSGQYDYELSGSFVQVRALTGQPDTWDTAVRRCAVGPASGTLDSEQRAE
jgi:hypothetical protein